MALELTLIRDDNQFPASVRLEADGSLTITQTGWVNTEDPVHALSAAGMPAQNQPFDAVNYPDVLFAGATIDHVGGVPFGDAENTGGVSKVTLTWRTEGYGGTRPTTAYTELDVGTETFEANFAVSGPWATKPINNGDGVSVEQGLVVAKVHVFYPETSAPINYGRLLTLMKPNKVNNAPLSLPRILRSQTFFNMGVGQVRYKQFSVQAADNVLELIHTLVLAENHNFRWRIKDRDGNSVGIGDAPVYAEADMTGLWP